MEKYCVYILWSEKVQRHYVGFSTDLEKRLNYHNTGRSGYTKKGIPRILFWFTELDDESQARWLENKIKSRGASRYLSDIGFEKE